MIVNAISKFYSDHKKPTQRSFCSSIFKKLTFSSSNSKSQQTAMTSALLLNESSGELLFKNEIKIETKCTDSLLTRDTLVTNYLTAASFQNQYEYKIALHSPDESYFLGEKNTSSYNLNKNLNFKQKIANKFKNFTSHSTNKEEKESMCSIFNKNDSKANFLYESFKKQLNSANNTNKVFNSNNSSKSSHSRRSGSSSFSSRSNSLENEHIKAHDSLFLLENSEPCFDEQVTSDNAIADENKRITNPSEFFDYSDSEMASSTSSSKDNDKDFKLMSNDSVQSFPKINQILDLKLHRLPGW